MQVVDISFPKWRGNTSIESCTDCLKGVPVALGVISSADEDSSDSLSEPVAKKRDIVERSRQSVKRNEVSNDKAWPVVKAQAVASKHA